MTFHNLIKAGLVICAVGHLCVSLNRKRSKGDRTYSIIAAILTAAAAVI